MILKKFQKVVAFVIDGNYSGVSENICTKFTHKLALTVVNLDLKMENK